MGLAQGLNFLRKHLNKAKELQVKKGKACKKAAADKKAPVVNVTYTGGGTVQPPKPTVEDGDN